MEEIKLKCRKCREVLAKSPPNQFRDLVDDQEEGNLYSLSEDNAPDWVNNLVEQGGWTKGKLQCPNCGNRVGGFDFVSGNKEPIYIVKSKVDFWSPVSAAVYVEPKVGCTETQHDPVPITSTATQADQPTTQADPSATQADPTTSEAAQAGSPDPPTRPKSSRDSVATSASRVLESMTTEDQLSRSVSELSTSNTEESDPSQGSCNPQLSDTSEGEGLEVDKDEGTSTSSNYTDHESSEDDEYPTPVSRRQIEKQKRRRRRRERERKRMKEKKSELERVEAKVRELMEAEPELEELSDQLICPVCLDLLHEPFQTEPCRHIFCEPCLRRLGQKNAMNTRCPLCRTRIRFCKHLAATAREIREQHEYLYLRRKKFERGTPVYSYPLPWTPGWRNLIRGRPLGGNRLLVENNHAEYLRTILLQIPYYIPPVMFANVINIIIFGFMIGLVELLPAILTSLFGSHRGSAGVANLTDFVHEISGDTIPAAEDSSQQSFEDVPIVMDSVGPEALDSTFYFILFILSLIAAGFGQFILNQDPGERLGYRLTDVFLIICLTSLPLLVLPTLLPYRAPEGPYLGMLLKKMMNFVFGHFSFQTFLLVVVLACFVYHFDGNEDMILA